MTGGDRGLHLVRPGAVAAQGGVEKRRTFEDGSAVPTRPVLLFKSYELAGIVDAGGPTSVLEKH